MMNVAPFQRLADGQPDIAAGRAVMESHASGAAACDVMELWTNLRGILVAG